MNSVQVIGRLTKDPELRMSNGGEPLCSMRIAVDRMGDHASVGYVDVAVFGRSGEACAAHLSRGWLVGASGRLRYREWTGPDGSSRSALSIVGAVDFLFPPPRPADTRSEEPVAA
jgi:single-strand DNA-binding protein